MMKHLILNRYIALLMAGSLLFTGCDRKDDVNLGTGSASVKVNLKGAEAGDVLDNVGQKAAASAKRNIKNEADIQIVEVPFSKELTLVATMGLTEQIDADQVSTRAAVNTGRIRAARTDLEQGVSYRLLVYNPSGTLAKEADYTVGGALPELKLDAGTAYTFVCYSLGAIGGTLPDVEGKTSLSTAMLQDVSGNADLMYVAQQVTLQEGENNLDLVLKHMFSQITVQIVSTEVGAISGINDVFFTPHYAAVDLHLNDGTRDYKDQVTSGSAVVFPAGTATTRTSTPTIIAAPLVTDGVLTIGSISTATGTRENIQLTGLSFVPGQRYTLKLNILQNMLVVGNVMFSPSNLVYTNGVWHFGADQSEPGSHFPFKKKDPVYGPALTTIANSRDGDPCNEVAVPAGSVKWRTPTYDELSALAQQPLYELAATLNGVRGVYSNFKGGNRGIFLPLSGRYVEAANRGIESVGRWADYAQGDTSTPFGSAGNLLVPPLQAVAQRESNNADSNRTSLTLMPRTGQGVQAWNVALLYRCVRPL